MCRSWEGEEAASLPSMMQGGGVPVLTVNTKRELGKKAQSSNIAAGKVRSSRVTVDAHADTSSYEILVITRDIVCQVRAVLASVMLLLSFPAMHACLKIQYLGLQRVSRPRQLARSPPSCCCRAARTELLLMNMCI